MSFPSTPLTGDEQALSYIQGICRQYAQYHKIDPSVYERYGVKRGLRNADGTGVMAGITQIGNVRGYYIEDGEKVPMDGQLIYRGINVQDLIGGFMTEGRFGYEETAYLLLFGTLPTQAQLSGFRDLLAHFRSLPANFTEDMILKAPSRDVMNKLARSTLALYSYDPDPENKALEAEMLKAVQLIARYPVIVAHAFACKRHYYDNESLYLHRPQEGLSVAENFLYSVRHDNQFTQDEARLLDLCLVLHMEHGGGNNSAFACRVLSSSGTDIYSAIAAAVGSLKGPKHGGANMKVMEMFGHIERDVSDWKDEDAVSSYLEQLLRRHGSRHLHPVRPPGGPAQAVRPAGGGKEGYAGRVRAVRNRGAPGSRGISSGHRPGQGHVCQRGPVFRLGVQDDGHSPGAVHPPVCHRPHRGLVRPSGGRGLQPLWEDHPPSL